MTLVLLVLAVIWAVVLVPPALRARAEGRPADSISAFRRQLAVLRRTGPRSGPMAGTDMWPNGQSYTAPVVPMMAARGRGRHPQPQAIMARPDAAPARAGRPSASAARQRTLQRRRDVLVGLVAAAGATLVLGVLPALRMVWVLHLVIDALLCAYVALLIHQRNVAAEREMKVRFLPGPAAVDPRFARHEPALLRRSAT